MAVIENAIDALALLLSEWTDKTFPVESRDIPALNHLWITLANVLCNSDSSKVKAFQQEVARLRSSEHAGSPPIDALKRRLYELAQTDIDEAFLVIAIRQSMEQLIIIEFPTSLAIQKWKQLADTILPLQIQFAHSFDKKMKKQITLSPEE